MRHRITQLNLADRVACHVFGVDDAIMLAAAMASAYGAYQQSHTPKVGPTGRGEMGGRGASAASFANRGPAVDLAASTAGALFGGGNKPVGGEDQAPAKAVPPVQPLIGVQPAVNKAVTDTMLGKSASAPKVGVQGTVGAMSNIKGVDPVTGLPKVDATKTGADAIIGELSKGATTADQALADAAASSSGNGDTMSTVLQLANLASQVGGSISEANRPRPVALHISRMGGYNSGLPGAEDLLRKYLAAFGR